jgi:single-strand DNA-binding protein
MSDLNNVALVARLTRDPEAKPVGETTVANLRVAFNTRAKVDGEWTEKGNFVDVTVWGQQADFISEYGAKGRQVSIAGRLDWREWDDKEGNKRQSVGIIASDIALLGPKAEADSESQPETESDPF